MKTLPSHLPRRRMLQLGLGATAGIFATGIGCKNASGENAQADTAAATCEVTPDQTLGPFYPHIKNGDGDVDLTTIQGKEGKAQGTVILVRGKITDENCLPIENALVEMWQANHGGRYSHEGDAKNPIPLDPNFEGWGEMTTSTEGSYGFKTIKPGAYSFDDPDVVENWRTPHIHFKVSRRGYHEIVTQLYFEGEELNKTDTVLAELPEEERAQFILSPVREEGGIPVFSFDLRLKKVATAEERLAALEACTGKYNMSLPYRTPNEEVLVHRDGQQLFLDMHNYATVELKPMGKDEFLATSIDCRLVFNRHDDGTVNSVTVYGTSKLVKIDPSIGSRIS